ncbi:hypothetical protein NIES2104_00030 [Leptolyngbya sp. NIES-2104]|nr:hypothetical protein NIES2104_00030 [Leptolyngbya sp. NIES-2104]
MGIRLDFGDQALDSVPFEDGEGTTRARLNLQQANCLNFEKGKPE